MRVNQRAWLGWRALGVLLVMVAVGTIATAGPPGPPEAVPAPAPAQQAPAVDAPTDYGSVEASQEATERAEAMRQEAFARQRELNRTMQAQADPYAVDPPAPGAVYAMLPPAPLPPPLAFGPRRARYAAQSQMRYSYYYPYPMLRAYRGVFEPWPFVPGDVYGYPFVPRVPMPLGQVQIEIGPGRILSRPVYEGEGPAGGQPTLAPPLPGAGQPEVLPPPPLPELNPPEAQPPAPAPPVPPGPKEF